MAQTTQSRFTDSSAGPHRDALDGVRGVAILLVILFHSLKFDSGWAGVQVFFVLSGYLITSILLRESTLPLPFYLKRFYWRRALRIFPLYYGYLIVLAIVYFAIRPPGPPPPLSGSLWGMSVRQGITTFARDWPYLFTYTINLRRLLPDFGASNPYYGRFWSLAVEEQYYLMWPLLVYCIPRKYFSRLVAGILIGAPICRALTAWLLAPMLHYNSSAIGGAVNFATTSQLDAFAAGAAAVLLGDRLRKRALPVFAACTLLLLACGQIHALLVTGHPALTTGLGYEVNMMGAAEHIWGYTVINFWSAGLILAASSRNLVSAMLAFPPLAYLGRISYGMYVYHQIVLFAGLAIFGSLYMNTRHGFVAYFICVVVISDLSYRLYESRFLRLKDKKFIRPKMLVAPAPG